METLIKAPPITVEQFLNFKSPPGYRAELLDGEIILSPDPKPIHHDVVMNVFDQVWNIYPCERCVVIPEAASRREVSDGESIFLPHPFPALPLDAGEFFVLQ